MGPPVRPTSVADVEQLVTLLGILFDQERDFSSDATCQRHALEALIASPDRGRVIIAERQGRAVGMVTLQVVTSTRPRVGRRRCSKTWSSTLTCGGEGIGTALLGTAVEEARAMRCQRVTLLTDAGNRDAQRFYRRHGFTRSGMVPMRLLLGG